MRCPVYFTKRIPDDCEGCIHYSRVLDKCMAIDY